MSNLYWEAETDLFQKIVSDNILEVVKNITDKLFVTTSIKNNDLEIVVIIDENPCGEDFIRRFKLIDLIDDDYEKQEIITFLKKVITQIEKK